MMSLLKRIVRGRSSGKEIDASTSNGERLSLDDVLKFASPEAIKQGIDNVSIEINRDELVTRAYSKLGENNWATLSMEDGIVGLDAEVNGTNHRYVFDLTSGYGSALSAIVNGAEERAKDFFNVLEKNGFRISIQRNSHGEARVSGVHLYTCDEKVPDLYLLRGADSVRADTGLRPLQIVVHGRGGPSVRYDVSLLNDVYKEKIGDLLDQAGLGKYIDRQTWTVKDSIKGLDMPDSNELRFYKQNGDKK